MPYCKHDRHITWQPDNLTLLRIDMKTKVVQHDNYHDDYYDYHDNYHDDYHNENHDYRDDYHDAWTLNLSHLVHLWKHCFPCFGRGHIFLVLKRIFIHFFGNLKRNFRKIPNFFLVKEKFFDTFLVKKCLKVRQKLGTSSMLGAAVKLPTQLWPCIFADIKGGQNLHYPQKCIFFYQKSVKKNFFFTKKI